MRKEREVKGARKRKRERERESEQFKEKRSDFAFLPSLKHSLFTLLHCESKYYAVLLGKVLCQIRNTLFGDCTRTLLSPSGVSEET